MAVRKSPPENTILHERLAQLAELQQRVTTQPYSILSRLSVALAYKRLGYPDLAVGDAYKALLLVDEVSEEGEFHDEAVSAAQADVAVISSSEFTKNAMVDFPSLELDDLSANDEDKALSYAETTGSKIAYSILVGCLIDCGCLKSAFEYNNRAKTKFPQETLFDSYGKAIIGRLQSHFGDDFDTVDISEYPDRGMVRRELYPWNEYEPDRFSSECLQFLNDEMAKVAPKLEVKIATLPILSPGGSNSPEQASADPDAQYVKQLGIFAKEDIQPGEVILREKSLLTAVSRLHESFCDACSLPLSKAEDAEEIRACEECDYVFFCSAECEQLAQDQYHPALCGVSIDQKVSASEASDHLYYLLLIRALALAETQELHPLELKEVRYIWGDYHGLDLDREWRGDPHGPITDAFANMPQTLPFSFKDSVQTPLNVLERMDINIFEQSYRYDTWVINTLYAKFRGTASARQGLDGKPEVSAVHPMWCLGNHSCDPNVAWEWEGSIKFWTREQLVEWKGRPDDKKPGLRKGEELMGHYCDITLPVKERREWAVGALGGDCMCPRCVWEAGR